LSINKSVAKTPPSRPVDTDFKSISPSLRGLNHGDTSN